MRVFVTGASGFVGSAVIEDLVAAGHEVRGLVRSDEAAAQVAAAGVTPHRGSLEDLDSLRAGAAWAEGVIHTAFNHDFSRFADNAALDQAAIETLGAALEGSSRPLLVTSGFARLTQGREANEDDLPPVRLEGYPRVSEQTAMALADRGVHASSVRLAPSVHDRGDHGFVPTLIQVARETGVSAYVGDGANRWPGVHRRDAARLFRLALEDGRGGARWHGAAEAGLPFKSIAEAIGRGLGLPVEPRPAEHFGWIGAFAGMDVPASSALTRQRLGWTPKGPGLLEDIATAGYLDA